MIPLLFALMTVHVGPVAKNLPSRQPQMASNGALVGLTFGEGKAIYFAGSRDGGKSFSPPVKVAEAAVLMLGRHRGPRIALAGESVVITAFTGNKAGAEDLYAWRSIDGGVHWSKGIMLNDLPGAANEGLDGLSSDGKSKLFVAWLDFRGKGKQLWGTRSVDGGETWAKNAPIYASPDGHICECCHPSVAIDGAGRMLVMWRNWLGGSRDMYLAQSEDGVKFSGGEKLGTGTWPLNACPMDGGGLAVSGSKVVTAWRRGESVFVASPGQAEVKMGQGKDVALALDGDTARAAWTNGTKIESWVGGKTETLSEAGAFPAMVSLPGGGVVVAWEEAGTIAVRVMR
jgi:hypothetical protein